jgi:hypothetical protein
MVHIAKIRGLCPMVSLMDLLRESADRFTQNLDLGLGVVGALDRLRNDGHRVRGVSVVDVRKELVIPVVGKVPPGVALGAITTCDDHRLLPGAAPVDVVVPLSVGGELGGHDL